MKSRKRTGFTAMGLLLIAAALFLSAHHGWQAWSAGQSARETARRLAEQIPRQSPALKREELGEEKDPPGDETAEFRREMSTIETDGNQYIGMLDIPALGLNLPVMDMWSGAKLKLAPCRYSGSVYQDDLIIAAHNYPRHFGGLKELDVGDEVVFTDVQGETVSYSVIRTEILDGSAVEEMERGEWALTLFTCTPGGKGRVTVRCGRLEKEWGQNEKS